MAVADVFDALVSDRPYKRAWSTEEVIAHIEAQAGIQFDPACVAALIDKQLWKIVRRDCPSHLPSFQMDDLF